MEKVEKREESEWQAKDRKICVPDPKVTRRDSALYESLLLGSYTDAMGRPA
jgi:hypothetical protein